MAGIIRAGRRRQVNYPLRAPNAALILFYLMASLDALIAKHVSAPAEVTPPAALATGERSPPPGGLAPDHDARLEQAEARTKQADARTEQAEMRTEQAEARHEVQNVIASAEHRRLEAQFIEGQKMDVIGQLAGGVAHDFNNILAIIIGCNDMMELKLGPNHPLKKYNQEIRHASERAVGLTRQLLVFIRKGTVQPVVLNLADVLEDLDQMLRRLIDANIELTIAPGPNTGCVKTDAGYVGQVLMNLVVNARDAMPNGGKLTIATSNATLDENYVRTHPSAVAGEYVMLSVSDTGTGMTAEVQARLFEPFFTTKPSGKGTGLGLATCQTIVQHSGGHIGVYSEVGKGTIFKVYFPRVRLPVNGTQRPFPIGPLPRGTETLLVVED